ncbi:TIGR02221 family CRISPR-associated protein [Tuwongella immobilis]|uniref:Uncharacterized protein n=1 Tax=Tuwongella immobilis TaxID=692036 RepID=A0A6C2YMV3_9BACT|nr:TIGR02221 family CRISPR-associated protein [Tuwongella immobilis]VIP02242.1 CRISPR-associated protein TM1812 OS=Psychrobacter sp. JCM 18903 GN=JCM18903_3187 PE=4 SV=1: Cas_DxTHG [Tuwongella immobilis]VTS00813.1 CRISPR-associated protein TM1812 OS=Psychrobacter sp. JCM 18903 GN=JCM18903_3187 PE=4 SV=1: Cas_DxTHG [Tuwongella immobilis]
MPTTVVSFIGTGRRSNEADPRTRYSKTTYRFLLPGIGARLESTSLFGVGLLRYLRATKVDVDRWLVMGTSASLWSELYELLDNPDEVLEEYCEIDELVAAKQVTTEALAKWQSVLNSRLNRVQFSLCLTGSAMELPSQHEAARAMFQHIPRGNRVVMDITHGFRHQPVIATAIVSLMRWTHDIQHVRYFYGAYDAREGDVAPAVELPIFQELLEATEASAILDTTGNYQQTASRLGMDAELAWFLESTNQLGSAKNQVNRLQQVLSEPTDPIRTELHDLLADRLEWARQDKFVSRYRQAARNALDQNDYFRAVVLVYEGLLVLANSILRPGSDPVNYQYREESGKEIVAKLSGEEKRLFKHLANTRNACAHGTRSDVFEVQQILATPQAFRAFMEEAFGLFDRFPKILADEANR